jgi:L-ascorbate metabolism protein UlaG (beta-lactamase superfamily)
MSDIRNFPYKSAKVLVPLNNGSYFKKNNFKDVRELDWFDEVKINENLTVTLMAAQHWNKRSVLPFGPGATDKALWGSFLINYKGKKIFFACDTGYSNIYKMMGQKFGGVDIFLINAGSYNFEIITGKKDFSIFHTNPEEALQAAKDIKAKKVIPMHYGSFLLGLEGQNSEGPINEPRNRLLKNAEKYGFKKKDIKIFNIGQISTLNEILND